MQLNIYVTCLCAWAILICDGLVQGCVNTWLMSFIRAKRFSGSHPVIYFECTAQRLNFREFNIYPRFLGYRLQLEFSFNWGNFHIPTKKALICTFRDKHWQKFGNLYERFLTIINSVIQNVQFRWWEIRTNCLPTLELR